MAAKQCAWTNEKIAELIDVFETKPCLYNTKHIEYHNRDLRRKALSEISEMMGFSGKVYIYIYIYNI